MPAAEIDTVGKASRLLGMLGEAPHGATLSQLSKGSGYPLSSVHRLLASLRRDSFVAFDEPTKRYSLGLRLYQLGAAVAAARGFSGAALPVVRELAAETGEAALMSVLDGQEQLHVHHVEGRQAVGVRSRTGGRDPLHSTASGKVLVAFSGSAVRDELVAWMPLVASTPRTLTSRSALAEEIAAVGAQGFAVSDEEHQSGIRAIAVPVPGPTGHALAALSVSAPAYRMTVASALRLLPALHGAASRLAVLLPAR